MTPKRAGFYSVHEFPFLSEICENWKAIRDEYLNIDAPVLNISTDGKKYEETFQNLVNAIKNDNTYGWILGSNIVGGNDRWLVYGIMYQDEAINEVLTPYLASKIPETLKLVAKIQETVGIKVCGFVKLKAHTYIPPHQHLEMIEEKLLQLHIPVKTAGTQNYAYLNVNGEFRTHETGIPIVFDGSNDHFVINASDEDRVIFYLEFKAFE